jgi:hypothetical protein
MPRAPRGGPTARREPPRPEGAANPARARPRHHATEPVTFKLYDGHLTAECSIVHNGAPACPACLARLLAEPGG